MDWFLYGNGLRHERVKLKVLLLKTELIVFSIMSKKLIRNVAAILQRMFL